MIADRSDIICLSVIFCHNIFNSYNSNLNISYDYLTKSFLNVLSVTNFVLVVDNYIISQSILQLYVLYLSSLLWGIS